MNLPPAESITFPGKSNWERQMENTIDANLVYIARDGHIIGRYHPEGILKGFACGFFLPTDLGWEPGLGAWLLLTEIVHAPAASSAVPVASEPPDQVECEPAAELPPAESQQLLFSLDEYLGAVQV